MIANTGSYAARGGGLVLGDRVLWLGVIAAVYEREVSVLQRTSSAGSFIRDTINIGVVYKARAVDEVVDMIFAENGLSRLPEPHEQGVAAPDAASDSLAESPPMAVEPES